MAYRYYDGSKTAPNANKALLALLNREVDSFVHRAITAYKKSYKQLREEAVANWYSKYNFSDARAINLSTVYDIKTSYGNKSTQGTVYIRLNSEVDIEKLKNFGHLMSGYENLIKWYNRHNQDGWNYPFGNKEDRKPHTAIPFQYSAEEEVVRFLLDLRWNQGIANLPQKSHWTSWTNQYFKQTEDTAGNYVKKYIKINLDDRASDVMRGRVTRDTSYGGTRYYEFISNKNIK